MYSRLARTSLAALALLGLCTVAGTASAAEQKVIDKCSAAIIKSGAAFVQAEAKILQKCEDAKLKGKTCDQGKVTESIGKARAKLASGISKACAGKDKSCATEDADGTQPTLTEIAWNIGTCPDFEGKGCTNTIANCSDIATCIQCIGEESIEQAIALYYPTGRPSSVGNKVLNKCQAGIGKAGAAFFAARSKALAKCWGGKIKNPAANCAASAIPAVGTASGKLAASITKACPGLDNSTVGIAATCLAVTPEGAASCAASVSSVTDIANCLDCVTDFKDDCADRLSAKSVGATYPAECLIAPPTPTATATPVPTATPTLTVGPTATATPGICGDNQIQAGEFCDGTATGGACGAGFTCTNCNCACPSTVHFTGDATNPNSILDTGWTGIAHRAPIISNGDVTVSLSCGPSTRPCGQCTITGPVENVSAGAGQLDNHRCSHDSSIKCNVNGDCGMGNTCQFYFGGPLPLAAGGVTTCVYNQFNGQVNGTANVETGEAATTAFLTSRVYTGISIDSPCPRCSDTGGINDGTNGGTCTGGTRNGLACDANGSVFNRPDFGRTSLDCPLDASVLIATLPINLTNETNPVTKTLTTASPNCGPAAPGQKCLCQTCNNAAATPCFTNADCVAVGATVCGGNRCVGGPTPGLVCATTPECGTGGICGRAGEPTKPSACLDDSSTVNILDCTDTSPVDGEGECTSGPITQSCSVASGHAQRGCMVDADCSPGTCESNNRQCFLTGGGTFQTPTAGIGGTDTLIAAGMEDPPMGDVSNPTLGAVFCVGPTGSTSVNNVAGLPGPGRVTIAGTATGQP